jgi:hypothetical protein
MDAQKLRILFRDFAGEDRYRKFVRAIDGACQSKHRLLFWQQDLWQEFVLAIPLAPLAPRSDSEILAAFRVCYCHGCDLRPPPEGERLPEIRRTPESELAGESLFPFAEGRGFICPLCREARQKWISENRDLCNLLRRRTTLEEFCHRHFGDLADTAEFKDRATKNSPFSLLTCNLEMNSGSGTLAAGTISRAALESRSFATARWFQAWLSHSSGLK